MRRRHSVNDASGVSKWLPVNGKQSGRLKAIERSDSWMLSIPEAAAEAILVVVGV